MTRHTSSRSLFRLLLPVAVLTGTVALAGLPSSAGAAPVETGPAEVNAAVEETDQAGAADASVSAAAPNQISVWKATDSQTAGSYWEPNLNQPANYVSPVNYAGGQAYIKIVVETKPSNTAMKPLVCFWRHSGVKFRYETCRKAATFSTTGTYYTALGTPTGWWKKGGVYDWSVKSSVGRIMLSDPGTGKLFLGSKCGRACYRGGDLGSHVPVKMTSELIFVAKGSTLVPPADWQAGCPRAWSAQCGG